MKQKEEVYTSTTIVVTVADPDGGHSAYQTRISGNQEDAFKQIQTWETVGIVTVVRPNGETFYLPTHRVLHYRVPK